MSIPPDNLTPRRSFLLGINAALLPFVAPLRMFSQINDRKVNPLVNNSGQSGVISTVVGGGPVGNKPATQAAISAIFSLSVDASNNVYASDNNYHRIYQISASTGLLTTVAGTGIPGYSGDGGPATAASLNYPYGIAVDPTGDLYIADANNDRVRYVSAATGLISTLAGTGKGSYNGDNIPASTAEVAGPHGVAVGSTGLVYIADSNNSRIRLVNTGAAAITVFPLSSSPIVVAPGQIATVAGTGTAGFSGDNGPAIAAELNLPWGVLVDGSGNIYIADYYNQRVRYVNAQTGKITTIAGVGISGDTGDGGSARLARIAFPSNLALDQAGNLYIGQEQVSTVRMVAAGTGIISTVAGDGVDGTSGDGGPARLAEVNSPTGVALDSSQNLYIGEFNDGRVRRVDAVTQIITTFAGSTDYGDGGPATQATLNRPVGCSYDLQGRLTVTDQENQEIRRVETNGAISRVAGTGVSGYNGDGIQARDAQINIPADVQFDSAGNMYICDRGNARIRMVDVNTGLISTVAGNGQVGSSGDGGPAIEATFNQARAIWLGPNGALWIAELDSFRIRFVNLSSTPVTLYPAGPTPILVPPGYIVTAAGNGTSGSDGDGGPAIDAQVNSPRGVTLDAQGNIYATEGGRDPQNLPGPGVKPDSKVRKIDASTGIISTVAGTQKVGYNGDGIPATQANLNGPRNVVLDAAGNMYISDNINNRIRRVDAVTGLISTLVGGNHVGFAGDGGGLGQAQVCGPRYVNLDPNGNLIFSDDGNSRYRLITFH